LVATWMAANASAIPIGAQGSLDGAPSMMWRTRVQEDRAAKDLGASVVRVEVIDRKSPNAVILTLDLLRRDDRRSAGGSP